MICKNCEDIGRKLVGVMTEAERIQAITAQAILLRGVTNRNDKLVGNSIITKLLLSFTPKSREDIIRFIRGSDALKDFDLKDCPHTMKIVGV